MNDFNIPVHVCQRNNFSTVGTIGAVPIHGVYFLDSRISGTWTGSRSRLGTKISSSVSKAPFGETEANYIGSPIIPRYPLATARSRRSFVSLFSTIHIPNFCLTLPKLDAFGTQHRTTWYYMVLWYYRLCFGGTNPLPPFNRRNHLTSM